MFLNRFRIATRLGMSFSVLLLLFLLLTGFAINALKNAVDDYHRGRVQSSNVELALKWAAATQLNVNRVLGIAHSDKAVAVENHFGPLIAKTSEDITTYQKKLEASIDNEKLITIFKSVSTARVEYIAQRKNYFDVLKKEGSAAANRVLYTDLTPAAEHYMASQANFITAFDSLILQDATASEAKVNRTVTLLIVLVVLALGFGVVMAFVMVRSITTPIGIALAATKRIAGNDLSQDIVVVFKDEFGTMLQSMQTMQHSLRGVVEDIRQSSESLGVSSQQIASGSMDLSVRTEQTASNLAEAAASMGELTLTVRHSADASNLAKKMASSASDLAKKGESAMSDVAKRMRDIESSGQQIANIVGTIDAIAFQTNILALNAAVEAARAGDQGRGFAVVATEVRILAKRSADAAKEIKTLIDASVKNIQDGSGQVHRAGATMDEVATSVQHVSEMVSQITLSTEEQSRGISQVNIAVAQLDQMTQQNAALVEEYSAAAEGLREQATQLNQSMAMFQTHKR